MAWEKSRGIKGMKVLSNVDDAESQNANAKASNEANQDQGSKKNEDGNSFSGKKLFYSYEPDLVKIPNNQEPNNEEYKEIAHTFLTTGKKVDKNWTIFGAEIKSIESPNKKKISAALIHLAYALVKRGPRELISSWKRNSKYNPS